MNIMMMNVCRQLTNSSLSLPHLTGSWYLQYSSDDKLTPRMREFKKKLREKTPISKLDQPLAKHPNEEQESLEPWPNNTNPHTGEIGGPKGPEPTRYGDWERKGRVSDF